MAHPTNRIELIPGCYSPYLSSLTPALLAESEALANVTLDMSSPGVRSAAEQIEKEMRQRNSSIAPSSQAINRIELIPGYYSPYLSSLTPALLAESEALANVTLDMSSPGVRSAAEQIEKEMRQRNSSIAPSSQAINRIELIPGYYSPYLSSLTPALLAESEALANVTLDMSSPGVRSAAEQIEKEMRQRNSSIAPSSQAINRIELIPGYYSPYLSSLTPALLAESEALANVTLDMSSPGVRSAAEQIEKEMRQRNSSIAPSSQAINRIELIPGYYSPYLSSLTPALLAESEALANVTLDMSSPGVRSAAEQIEKEMRQRNSSIAPSSQAINRIELIPGYYSPYLSSLTPALLAESEALANVTLDMSSPGVSSAAEQIEKEMRQRNSSIAPSSWT